MDALKINKALGMIYWHRKNGSLAANTTASNPRVKPELPKAACRAPSTYRMPRLLSRRLKTNVAAVPSLSVSSFGPTKAPSHFPVDRDPWISRPLKIAGIFSPSLRGR
jgi:hypothetical protein